MNNKNNPVDIGEILEALLDTSTIDDIEAKFLLDVIADKLTRRQTIILHLLLSQEGITQTEIGKLLGYSTPTINIEVRKIRQKVRQINKDQGSHVRNTLKLYEK